MVAGRLLGGALREAGAMPEPDRARFVGALELINAKALELARDRAVFFLSKIDS